MIAFNEVETFDDAMLPSEFSFSDLGSRITMHQSYIGQEEAAVVLHLFQELPMSNDARKDFPPSQRLNLCGLMFIKRRVSFILLAAVSLSSASGRTGNHDFSYDFYHLCPCCWSPSI
jgi:hypothetical protein